MRGDGFWRRARPADDTPARRLLISAGTGWHVSYPLAIGAQPRHALGASLPNLIFICFFVLFGFRLISTHFLANADRIRFRPASLGVLLCFTEFDCVLLGFNRFYWVLLGFTGFYWVLLGFTGFYWVLLGFTEFCWVLLSFTGFYWVLLGFTEFYWVLLSFTGFYWVLLGFTGFLLFLGL